MKVYDFAAFPNPARVRIALHEKGLTDEVEFVNVDLPNGEHRMPEFAAKNPSASVPVLELDCGTHISECTAITEYIDQAFEGPSLTGNTPKQRAIVHTMQRRAEQYMMDSVGDYFHFATVGLGPELENYQNSDWATIRKRSPKKGCFILTKSWRKTSLSRASNSRWRILRCLPAWALPISPK